MIRRYVPYVQTNFVFGLDIDEGPEPFELTKRFLEMTPRSLSCLFASHSVWSGGTRSTLNINEKVGFCPYRFIFLMAVRRISSRRTMFAMSFTITLSVLLNTTFYGRTSLRLTRQLMPSFRGQCTSSVPCNGFSDSNTIAKYGDGLMKTRNSDPSLRAKRQKFHSSMWSGYAKAWGRYGNGFQKGLCIMTQTPISRHRSIR